MKKADPERIRTGPLLFVIGYSLLAYFVGHGTPVLAAVTGPSPFMMNF